jgi:hypothetical protein
MMLWSVFQAKGIPASQLQVATLMFAHINVCTCRMSFHADMIA